VDPISLASSVEENEVAEEPTPAEAAVKAQQPPVDPTSHLRYIRHLQFTQPARPPMERFGQGYQDYIQSPLQPLSDNLESITYEVFEKDPIKYEWYKRATAEALKDLHTARVNDGKHIIVAIVGAGRGPLVTRALQASKETQIPIRCFAVEKNPNAHVLLQRRNARDPLWNKSVTVVQSDMRSWRGPPSLSASSEQPTTTASAPPAPAPAQSYDKVDILISELLGSFADNELSPECLDGVQHVLHPDHGINIPQRYSAHCTPIATPRLHADVLGRPNSVDHFEIPSVVMLQQLDFLCTVLNPSSSEDSKSASSPTPESIEQITPDVQEAWSFSHPIPESVLERSAPDGFVAAGAARVDNSHNVRSCKLVFQAQHKGVCHGLAGYFETVLYASPTRKDVIVELSTNPVTMEQKSKEMISWFPIWFPLKVSFVLILFHPFLVSSNDWRNTKSANFTLCAQTRLPSSSPTTPKSKSACGVKPTTAKSGTNGPLKSSYRQPRPMARRSAPRSLGRKSIRVARMAA
jgi:protein arginine N-methyltransferase 5